MTSGIQIDLVRIAGFRGIQNMEIMLSRATVLIGLNNSGKTSVLKALQLALGNYSQYVSEEDFFIGKDDDRTKKIIVDIRFIPTSDDQRNRRFNDQWISEFGDKIKQDIDNKDFVAIRTILEPDQVKGGFKCARYIMQKWPEFKTWTEEKIREKDRMRHRISSVFFIPIEAQRDIYHELKDKTSFAGRLLSDVTYNKEDIDQIEGQIQNINHEAVKKSKTLGDFKRHLQDLNKAFQGKGKVEISPFPKKIRDLAKHFSVHFGDQNMGVFSMEYHGMGTRSWASMLTVKAFIESLADKHEVESEAFFPVFSAEEPEAHLHPNAQKTLYRQIINTKGQIVISTHSPYFVSVSDISGIRSLVKTSVGVTSKDISKNLTSNEVKKINREIISRHGDILFAHCWILCEGSTEEQVIPALFELWEQKTLFDCGISCIGVGGKKNYIAFLKFAHNIGIPVYIISDNDQLQKNNQSTKEVVNNQIKRFNTYSKTNFKNVFFLSSSNDFENEVLLSLKDEIILAMIQEKTGDSDNAQYKIAKENEIKKWQNSKIQQEMKNNKGDYSSFLADIIRKNLNQKKPEKIVPKAILDCFKKIKKDVYA